MFLITDASTCLDIRHGVLHHSLTESQANAIELALQNSWSIDRHVNFDESLALMVSVASPVNTDTVFYVDAGPVGLSLSILQDDTLEHRGCYGSVDTLVTAIRAAA